MDYLRFGDSSKKFSIVLFVEDDVLKRIEQDVKKLGLQKNVQLIVQPCPFEAVEFLYRIDFHFRNGQNSFEKDFFWHALEFSTDMPGETLERISQQHYAYLIAIVQNDTQAVNATQRSLQSLIQTNA